MISEIQASFFTILRLGIGHRADALPKVVDWANIQALAVKHGLSAVVLDGIEKLPIFARPPKEILLEWIGEVLQTYEHRYDQYQRTIVEMVSFFNSHGYKMMVLKGYACSLDWPRPEHRPCGDIDIWLFGKQKEADELVSKQRHCKIEKTHHHHTVFNWGEFTVENHYDFINTHQHKSHNGLEQVFKELGTDDSCYVEINRERIYIPSPNLHALFLIRHALNHFASVGINLRQVLDWGFFVDKHTNDIDWKWLLKMIEEYHMKDFFNIMNAICMEDLGFDIQIFPEVRFFPSIKECMLTDILDNGLDMSEPKSLIPRMIFKFRRWKANEWKRKLCYNESTGKSFWSGLCNNLIKPFQL